GRSLRFQLARLVSLRRRRGPAAAGRDGPPHHRHTRQYGGEPPESRSDDVGRFRRAQRRRHAAALDQRGLSGTGRVRPSRLRTESARGDRLHGGTAVRGGHGSTAAVALALAGTATLWAQSGARNGEWPTYGADLGNTHYSPLSQIDATNFAKLEVAWRFKTDNLGPRPEFQFEGSPLMANGVVYSTAGTRRSVVALDAATGELLWVHGEREGPRGAAAPRQLSGRGLTYWTDGREERILYVTPGYRLIGLNAKTGVPVPGFGNNGAVDLKLDDDQEIDLITGEVGLHATPV